MKNDKIKKSHFYFTGSSPKQTKGDKKGAELKHKSLQLVIEDTNSQSATKSLNLSSTTLILFDEV